MNLKMPTFVSYKNFKMNGIKNQHYSFNQVLLAMLMSNLLVYLLSLPTATKETVLPQSNHVFIRVPLKLMIEYSKGHHFTVINQEQKIIIEEAVFVQEINKDNSTEAGLYLIEIPKSLTNHIPQLLKQDLTAIPQMTVLPKKIRQNINKGAADEDLEINF